MSLLASFESISPFDTISPRRWASDAKSSFRPKNSDCNSLMRWTGFGTYRERWTPSSDRESSSSVVWDHPVDRDAGLLDGFGNRSIIWRIMLVNSPMLRSRELSRSSIEAGMTAAASDQTSAFS